MSLLTACPSGNGNRHVWVCCVELVLDFSIWLLSSVTAATFPVICPWLLITDGGTLLTTGHVLQLADVTLMLRDAEWACSWVGPIDFALSEALISWLVKCTSYTGPSGLTFNNILLSTIQTQRPILYHLLQLITDKPYHFSYPTVSNIPTSTKPSRTLHKIWQGNNNSALMPAIIE